MGRNEQLRVPAPSFVRLEHSMIDSSEVGGYQCGRSMSNNISQERGRYHKSMGRKKSLTQRETKCRPNGGDIEKRSGVGNHLNFDFHLDPRRYLNFAGVSSSGGIV